MRKLLALCLLLCGCGSAVAQGPGDFATGSAISVGSNQVNLIAEAFDDGQGTLVKDFPLPSPVQVDAFNGTLSYYGLNGRCEGNNTATVGYLSSEAGVLTTWDFQSQGNLPINIPIIGSFPGGVPVSNLHIQMYNDLCLPTNFRIAVTFHRVTSKEEEK